MTLDETDRKIVQLLQDSPETSHREIASQVGLSQPSVSARVKKLREKGHLRIMAGIDLLQSGLTVGKVDILTTDPDLVLRSFSKCPLLLNAYQTTGRTNLTMLFAGEGAGNLQSIVDVHIRRMASVQEADLQVIVRSERPIVQPVAVEAGVCDRTVCGFTCSTCGHYREDLCTGCPASVFYKGTFWR